MAEIKMTLMQAIREYLLLPGEQLKTDTFKALTPEDKNWLVEEFKAIGVTVERPSTVVAS
jgi:hypothetical protein